MADLSVVGGASHVGIPLVLALADAGLTVNVNDLNETALAMLSSGKSPFIEHGAAPLLAKALESQRLICTSSPKEISDEFLNPVQVEIQRRIDGPRLENDGRPSGHGVQGRDRRYARVIELKTQAIPRDAGACGPHDGPFRDGRSCVVASRAGGRAPRHLDPLHAALRLRARRFEGEARRRRVGFAQERECRVLT
jgi:hypothetical protein